MEKIERWIYGFFSQLGGVLLLIYAGGTLIGAIESFLNIIFFPLFIYFIIIMLYGVILILIGALIMSVNIRVKKSIALIIFSIGILIVIISIKAIITYSFITTTIINSCTFINILEIFSGIGLIYLGIRLFIPNEERKKNEKKILGLVLSIIGLYLSLSYGFLIIRIVVSGNLGIVLRHLPYFLLPFLIGIILLIYIVYSTKERKNKAVLPILSGIFMLLIFLYILLMFFPGIVILFS